MGPERYFFELPIHRISEQAFADQYDRDLDAFRQSLYVPEGHETSYDLSLRIEQHFWETYGMPWQYNQAVGWVRLYVLGSQIRGDVWKAKGARLQRTGRRDYRYLGTAFQLSCQSEQASDEIRLDVEAQLYDVQRDLRRGHALDLECFRAVSPYVDWHALVFGPARSSG